MVITGIIAEFAIYRDQQHQLFITRLERTGRSGLFGNFRLVIGLSASLLAQRLGRLLRRLYRRLRDGNRRQQFSRGSRFALAANANSHQLFPLQSCRGRHIGSSILPPRHTTLEFVYT